jgi:Flp pilus assembly protein TadD
VAGALVVLGGCRSRDLVRAPQPQAAPPPQAPIEPGVSTVSVDLSRPQGGDQSFTAEVTESQRFHVHIDLGRVFERQGNYEAALLEYQEALAVGERGGVGKARSRDEALAHRRMGNALDGLGRFSQAEAHYKKALKLDPHNARIWNDAGYSYYLQGRWADAEGALKTAARMAPEDMRIKTNLGLVMAAAGRTDEALGLLSQYSGDAVGHANLGYLLAATGQNDLARREYEKALAIRPNLDQARRALDQLARASGRDEMLADGPPPPQDVQVRQTAARPELPPLPVRDAEPKQADVVRAELPPPPPLEALGVNP